jgi:hypothetical protein
MQRAYPHDKLANVTNKDYDATIPEPNGFRDGHQRSLESHAGYNFYPIDPDLFCSVGAVREIL